MMILPPFTRQKVLDDLGSFTKAFQTITLVNVSVTPSGYDEFTDSALVTPDATSGTGLIPSFAVSRICGRWNVVELPSINPFQGIPPGVESGDYLIWVIRRDYPSMQKNMDEAYSYIEVDGHTFKLQGVSPDGIGRSNEYRFIARKHKPVFARP